MNTDSAPTAVTRPLDSSAPTTDAEPAAAGDELTDQVLAGCPPLEALLDVLGELDSLNARAVSLVSRLQESGEAEEATGLPLELWLSVRGRQVQSDRRMLGTTADVLAWLPSLHAAFRRGDVSWGQVRSVVLAAMRLPSHLHDALDAELAATIPALVDAEPDALIHAVRRAADNANPGPTDRDEARTTRDRFVALQPRLDGSGGTLYGEFDPTGFAVLDAWFAAAPPAGDRVRDHLGEDPDDTRCAAAATHLGRRRADRLVERLGADLATGADQQTPDRDSATGDGSDHGDGPDRGNGSGRDDATRRPAPPRPTLLLRLPYDSLIGGDVPGDLLTTLTGGRLRLSAAASRELIDTGGADLRTIVVDTAGEVVGVGRRTRVAPGWLRDAILAQDATCSAPGCRTAARRCQLDHGHRWEDGGATDVANLAPVCATDNHARERDGWEATGTPDGTRRWHHPRTGLTATHVPDTWRPPPHGRRTGGPTDAARPTDRAGPLPPSVTGRAPAQRGRDPAVAPAPSDPSDPC